ncbi:phosphoribosyltransferase [Roseobacteraceae bacterium NS-SX3]
MFQNRTQAGEALARQLAEVPLPDPVVLALPRGGVPVAVPIARALGVPLDLLLVRKIGMPGNPELAAGALAEGGEPVFNAPLLKMAGLGPPDFEDLIAQERATNAKRRQLYLQGRAPVSVEGRTAIVVDDGIATGATMRAALAGLSARRPARIVLAVPVAPPETVDEFRRLVDNVVCLSRPDPFWAVGAHYTDFAQVSDAEVAAALAAADGGPGPQQDEDT